MARNFYDQDTSGVTALIEDIISEIKYDYEATITELRDELQGMRSDRDDLAIQVAELEDEVADLKVWHARRNNNEG